MCSKSMRRTSAGEIKAPHFGHTAWSDARTFSRLIFFRLGIRVQSRARGTSSHAARVHCLGLICAKHHNANSTRLPIPVLS